MAEQLELGGVEKEAKPEPTRRGKDPEDFESLLIKMINEGKTLAEFQSTR